MKYINLIKKSALATFIVIILSACTSGGSGTESGLNITGNWRGVGNARGTNSEINMTLAQTSTSVGGIKNVQIDGNLLFIGNCTFNFSGGVLNTETRVFTINPGGDVSVIGTVVNDSIITATISSVSDPEDPVGCGVFKSNVITFTRF